MLRERKKKVRKERRLKSLRGGKKVKGRNEKREKRPTARGDQARCAIFVREEMEKGNTREREEKKGEDMREIK